MTKIYRYEIWSFSEFDEDQWKQFVALGSNGTAIDWGVKEVDFDAVKMERIGNDY